MKYPEWLRSLLANYGAVVNNDGTIAQQVPSKTSRVNISDITYEGKTMYVNNDGYREAYPRGNENHECFNLLRENAASRGLSMPVRYLKHLAIGDLNTRIMMIFVTLCSTFIGKTKASYPETIRFGSEITDQHSKPDVKKETLALFANAISTSFMHVNMNVSRNHFRDGKRYPAFATITFPLYDDLVKHVANNSDPIVKNKTFPIGPARLYVWMIESLFPTVVSDGMVFSLSEPNDAAPVAQTFIRLLVQIEENLMHLSDVKENIIFAYINRDWMAHIGSIKKYFNVAAMTPISAEVDNNAVAETPNAPVVNHQQNVQVAKQSVQQPTQQPKVENKPFVFGAPSTEKPVDSVSSFNTMLASQNPDNNIIGTAKDSNGVLWYIDRNKKPVRPVNSNQQSNNNFGGNNNNWANGNFGNNSFNNVFSNNNAFSGNGFGNNFNSNGFGVSQNPFDNNNNNGFGGFGQNQNFFM